MAVAKIIESLRTIDGGKERPERFAKWDLAVETKQKHGKLRSMVHRFETFETVTSLLWYAALDARISFSCVVAFPKVLVDTIASQLIR
jgi:hypothetical protein